jgi:hypothetical protein
MKNKIGAYRVKLNGIKASYIHLIVRSTRNMAHNMRLYCMSTHQLKFSHKLIKGFYANFRGMMAKITEL